MQKLITPVNLRWQYRQLIWMHLDKVLRKLKCKKEEKKEKNLRGDFTITKKRKEKGFF